MKTWEPMFMDPEFKETVWGGTRIMSVFSKKIPSAHTGESWEVACRENGNSVIRNGKLAGKTLSEAMEEYPIEILGYSSMGKGIYQFPLLIKFIDADDDLSIQVHPDDKMAKTLEGPSGSGKTEMWYVIDAEEGAQIVYGFEKDITAGEFAKAVEDGSVEDLIHYVPVKKGDAFFIPAGTVHALGQGILVAEIQQNSDTTYRVYDYGRMGLDGKPRALHVEKAAEVLDFTGIKEEPYGNMDEGIVCPFFQAYRRNLRGMQEIAVSSDHFQILMILEGSGKVDGIPFRKGDTILLPAAGETVGLEGRAVYLQVL